MKMETYPYLGDGYRIEIVADMDIRQDCVLVEEDKLVIYVKKDDDERVKQALKRFYYQKCKALVESRIRIYQSSFKSKPRAIRIADNTAKWGSCDAKLQLTFNWRLAMAPLAVIDYIVVHEMCHMIHLNHDRSFWRLVGKLLPDYKERQSRLAESSWMMLV